MEPQNAIYNARQLGMYRMLILGVQHLFAMFGATVLVPLLTGLDVSVTLLFAGIGTLLFHFISKWNVPAFLGSSFAFLGGYASVKEMGVAQGLSETLALDYACLGVACAGMMYFVMAALIKSFGVKKILQYFPPVVTGPIVIAIGLVLSGSAITNCQTNWLLAIISIVTVIGSSIWGKGIIKIIPVLLGVIASYVIAACIGEVDFAPLGDAAWVGFPIERERTILAVLEDGNTSLMLSTILAVMPIAFATIMEHIGDMFAISSTVGKDYLSEPGLHRTKVFDPLVIRIAACLAIILAFCPKFACLVQLMPAATIGGVSLILYGMISAVGVRNLVEEQVDLKSSRNVFVAALILVLAIGVKYGANDDIALGPIHLSGLAIAAIVGIFLNAIMPSKLGMKVKSFKGKEK